MTRACFFFFRASRKSSEPRWLTLEGFSSHDCSGGGGACGLRAWNKAKILHVVQGGEQYYFIVNAVKVAQVEFLPCFFGLCNYWWYNGSLIESDFLSAQYKIMSADLRLQTMTLCSLQLDSWTDVIASPLLLTVSKHYTIPVGGSHENQCCSQSILHGNCLTSCHQPQQWRDFSERTGWKKKRKRDIAHLPGERETHLCMNSMILSLLRSWGSVYFSSPFTKYLRVGKPEILKRSDAALCTVASTAARTPGLCRRYKRQT